MSTTTAGRTPNQSDPPKQPLGIALLGIGTVGSSVLKLLSERRAALARLSGREIQVRYAMVRDVAKHSTLRFPKHLQLVDRIDPILNDRAIEIVVETIGGVQTAYSAIAESLKAGKHVVTANKAVLAERGDELFEIARKAKRAICFEAAVAGGIPIIGALTQTLCVNRIDEIAGILNGTSNYILSAMHERGWTYHQALDKARTLGFAEADPTLDVDGTDAAQKLAILARLAFQASIDAMQIPRHGIDRLDAADIQFANELGYVVKLLAVARPVDDRLHLNVGPTLVHKSHPLAKVSGEYNAIQVSNSAAGEIFLTGKGAGGAPTAASVVAGIVDIATGRGLATFDSMRLWEVDPEGPKFEPNTAPQSRFYLRYTIEDRPGTLAQIAGVLGKLGVSIASVMQHETNENQRSTPVPLIVMTHRADERAVRMALEQTHSLGFVRAPTVCLSVAG